MLAFQGVLSGPAGRLFSAAQPVRPPNSTPRLTYPHPATTHTRPDPLKAAPRPGGTSLARASQQEPTPQQFWGSQPPDPPKEASLHPLGASWGTPPPALPFTCGREDGEASGEARLEEAHPTGCHPEPGRGAHRLRCPERCSSNTLSTSRNLLKASLPTSLCDCADPPAPPQPLPPQTGPILTPSAPPPRLCLLCWVSDWTQLPREALVSEGSGAPA